MVEYAFPERKRAWKAPESALCGVSGKGDWCMMWVFPWALLFFLLMFCGIFILVLYYTKIQDRALQDLLRQQRAVRMELERLASALDSLLADRPLNDDQPDAGDPASPEAVPGLDHLLLGPDAGGPARPAQAAVSSAPSRPAASAETAHSDTGLPDLKL